MFFRQVRLGEGAQVKNCVIMNDCSIGAGAELYCAILDKEKAGDETVTALIEIKVQPKFGHGFDDIARRIAALEEVESIFLMSGGYDLCCLVTDKSFQEVSMFVASRLSPMEDVVSTATHFILKKYKEQGMLFAQKNTDDRGNISL